MDDVRQAAEERAARPKKAPVGSSFESERQREKNALVRQLDAQDGRNVHKISASPEIPEGERVLRVAAYCRVSTDDIDNKLFGTPVFQHEEGIRKLCSDTTGDNWEMLTPARPLDISHTVDAETVDNLLLEIIDDPPVLPPQSQEYPNTPINVNINCEEV